MSDRYGECRCPMLLAAAEVDRLAHMSGVRPSGFSSHTADALLVAILRDKHGCRGMRRGRCWWEQQLGFGGAGLDADDHGVPEIRPRPKDLPGEYL